MAVREGKMTKQWHKRMAGWKKRRKGKKNKKIVNLKWTAKAVHNYSGNHESLQSNNFGQEKRQNYPINYHRPKTKTKSGNQRLVDPLVLPSHLYATVICLYWKLKSCFQNICIKQFWLIIKCICKKKKNLYSK